MNIADIVKSVAEQRINLTPTDRKWIDTRVLKIIKIIETKQAPVILKAIDDKINAMRRHPSFIAQMKILIEEKIQGNVNYNFIEDVFDTLVKKKAQEIKTKREAEELINNDAAFKDVRNYFNDEK